MCDPSPLAWRLELAISLREDCRFSSFELVVRRHVADDAVKAGLVPRLYRAVSINRYTVSDSVPR